MSDIKQLFQSSSQNSILGFFLLCFEVGHFVNMCIAQTPPPLHKGRILEFPNID